MLDILIENFMHVIVCLDIFCSKVNPSRDIHKKLFLVTLLRPKTPKTTQRIQKRYRAFLVENFIKVIYKINILLQIEFQARYLKKTMKSAFEI